MTKLTFRALVLRRNESNFVSITRILKTRWILEFVKRSNTNNFLLCFDFGINFRDQLNDFKGTAARYCACTAMIDSGSWLTNRNRQNGVPQQCEYCGILNSSLCLKTNCVWPVTFCLKKRGSDWRPTMASNIAADQQVQVQNKKKKRLSPFAMKLIFEVLKTCVYLAMAYLLVSSSCLFLCNLHSQGSPTVVLVPAWQKLEGYVKDVLAEKMGTSLFFATRTKDIERRPRPTNTHTYALFSSSFHGRLSPQISFCDFLSFSYFLPLDTNRLRGESRFRPEPLRTPHPKPSRVDIQFLILWL